MKMANYALAAENLIANPTKAPPYIYALLGVMVLILTVTSYNYVTSKIEQNHIFNECLTKYRSANNYISADRINRCRDESLNPNAV